MRNSLYSVLHDVSRTSVRSGATDFAERSEYESMSTSACSHADVEGELIDLLSYRYVILPSSAARHRRHVCTVDVYLCVANVAQDLVVSKQQKTDKYKRKALRIHPTRIPFVHGSGALVTSPTRNQLSNTRDTRVLGPLPSNSLRTRSKVLP